MGVVNTYLGRLSKRMDQSIYREVTVIGQDLLEALGRTRSLLCHYLPTCHYPVGHQGTQ